MKPHNIIFALAITLGVIGVILQVKNVKGLASGPASKEDAQFRIGQAMMLSGFGYALGSIMEYRMNKQPE